MYNISDNSFTAVKVSGFTNVTASDINNSGVISGFGTYGGKTEGFVDDHGKVTVLTGPEGATSVMALGLNDKHEVVGSFTDASGTHGFLYEEKTHTYVTIDQGVRTTRPLTGSTTRDNWSASSLMPISTPMVCWFRFRATTAPEAASEVGVRVVVTDVLWAAYIPEPPSQCVMQAVPVPLPNWSGTGLVRLNRAKRNRRPGPGRAGPGRQDWSGHLIERKGRVGITRAVG